MVLLSKEELELFKNSIERVIGIPSWGDQTYRIYISNSSNQLFASKARSVDGVGFIYQCEFISDGANVSIEPSKEIWDMVIEIESGDKAIRYEDAELKFRKAIGAS